MKLQEVFDQLTTGEFSQLSIGGAGVGVINESNYQSVVNHVNLALTQLYKRFNLKTGHLQLELQPGQETYTLHSSFAVQGKRSTQPVRYIKDTVAEPFLDNILKVEQVIGDVGELPLNDANNTLSVTTPSDRVLRVPGIYEGMLTVVYRANHPKLLVGQGFFDPARVNLELPETHLVPLLWYVASRVHGPIGMGSEFNASNTYFAKYEASCQELEDKGLQIDKGGSNQRAARGGWV